MRIVSLLPSATEILFAVGAGPDVVGVTFECDTPAEARTRTIVSNSNLPEGLSPRQIDDFVTDATHRGVDMYRLEAEALTSLAPDLVVTQDLCAVCAVNVSAVDDALDYLGCDADVLTLDPHTIDDVLKSITLLGERTGRMEDAQLLVSHLRMRLAAVWAAVVGRSHPRTLVLEWTDPPFAPGHWIPEMVELAGGTSVLGMPGEKSYRVSWDDLHAAAPDVIVCAPCGYDLDASTELTEQILDDLPNAPVWAVDANASFARPGPRLVDGVEALTQILHSDISSVQGIARRVR